MSNLALKKIKTKNNINIDILSDNHISLKSNYGYKEFKINEKLYFYQDNKGNLSIKKKNLKDKSKDLLISLGRDYSKIKSLIQSLSQGYKLSLLLNGVGFKASIKDNYLMLKLGFSHEVRYKIPEDIIISIVKTEKIIIFGLDKEKVHQEAKEIINLKKRDPYKGKGILLDKEKIILKEGKKK